MQNTISNGQSKQNKDKRGGGLSGQFFTQLIKLESDIANKTYTAETLDELTQIYAQCVEYYDSVHDNISSYFIFKIQDILATKEAFKKLTKGNKKANAENNKQANGAEQQDAAKTEGQANGDASSGSYKIQVTGANGENEKAVAEHSEEEDDDDDEEIKPQRRPTEPLKSNRPARQSITAMKNKKQKLFSLHLKLQDQKANVKQSLQDVMASFGGHSQEIDKTVLKDISSQRRRILERVENKKRQNLTNYTQNMTAGFLNVKYADEDNKSMESFLKGLEEDEFPPSSQINDFNLSSNIINENGTEKSKENFSDVKETSIEKKQNEEENFSEQKSEENPVEPVVATEGQQEETKVAEENNAVVEEVVAPIQEEAKVTEENNAVEEVAAPIHEEAQTTENNTVEEVVSPTQEEAKTTEENNTVEEVASPSQEVIINKEEAKKLNPSQVAIQEQARSPLKILAAAIAAESSDNDDQPTIQVKQVATN